MGKFPAVAVAWKLNEESFLKDVASISTWKLEEVGVQDNRTLECYPSIPLYLISNSNGSIWECFLFYF
jgi:iron complex outermembrane receptor protein